MKKYIIILFSVLILLVGCSRSVSVLSDKNPSDTKLEWGLKKNENKAPDINPGEESVLRKYNGIYMGNPEKSFVYLTFDEGYENGYTAKILDTLKEKKVPACFSTDRHLQPKGCRSLQGKQLQRSRLLPFYACIYGCYFGYFYYVVFRT